MAAWMLPAAILGSSVLGAVGQNKAAKDASKTQQQQTNEPWGPLQQYLIGKGEIPSYITQQPQVTDQWRQWNQQVAGGQTSGPPPQMMAPKQAPAPQAPQAQQDPNAMGLTPEVAQFLVQQFAATAGQTQSNPMFNNSGGIEGGQGNVSPYQHNPQIPQGLAQAAGYPNATAIQATQGMSPEVVAMLQRVWGGQ